MSKASEIHLESHVWELEPPPPPTYRPLAHHNTIIETIREENASVHEPYDRNLDLTITNTLHEHTITVKYNLYKRMIRFKYLRSLTTNYLIVSTVAKSNKLTRLSSLISLHLKSLTRFPVDFHYMTDFSVAFTRALIPTWRATVRVIFLSNSVKVNTI